MELVRKAGIDPGHAYRVSCGVWINFPIFDSAGILRSGPLATEQVTLLIGSAAAGHPGPPSTTLLGPVRYAWSMLFTDELFPGGRQSGNELPVGCII